MLDNYDSPSLYRPSTASRRFWTTTWPRSFARRRKRGSSPRLDTGWDRSGKWFEHFRASMPYIDYFLPSVAEARMMAGGIDDVVEDGRASFWKRARKTSPSNSAATAAIQKRRGGLLRPRVRHQARGHHGRRGDAFVSGFMTALMLGKSNREVRALRLRHGQLRLHVHRATTTHSPSMEELEAFMANTPMKPPIK